MISEILTQNFHNLNALPLGQFERWTAKTILYFIYLSLTCMNSCSNFKVPVELDVIQNIILYKALEIEIGLRDGFYSQTPDL